MASAEGRAVLCSPVLGRQCRKRRISESKDLLPLAL